MSGALKLIRCPGKTLYYGLNIVNTLLGPLACVLSHVRLFATLWTEVHQAPLSKEFSRQEYWSQWPFPFTGNLPDPGVEPASLASPTLAGGFFTTEHLGSTEPA